MIKNDYIIFQTGNEEPIFFLLQVNYAILCIEALMVQW